MGAARGREGCEPVFLTDAEQEAFYGRICNDTLWPLFHYFVDRTAVHAARRGRSTSRSTSGSPRRSRGVSAPGARVWIHDFHLALVPAALRAQPARPRDRLLPAHPLPVVGDLPGPPDAARAPPRDARRGLHRVSHRRLCPALPLLVPARARDRVRARTRSTYDGRTIGIGVAPDRHRRRELPRDAFATRRRRRVEAELDERYEGQQLVLGIERLDYTKGIPQKLDAFERILERDPRSRDASRCSRCSCRRGSRARSTGRCATRSRCASPTSTAASANSGSRRSSTSTAGSRRPELAALYRRADVMMVTPLRDGMNLVAQEFVQCQSDDPGAGRAGAGRCC